jgi:hypothetical protein
MGQRANLLVLENGNRTLYYDHWCANRLEVELFWGFDETLHFIRQRDPVGEEEWLDEVWCEGAAVVDVDRKTLLFFGGEDVAFDVRLRNIHLDLLRRQWPGWDVRWAAEGILSIADYLGLPRDSFAYENDRAPSPFVHDKYFNLLVTEATADGLRLTRLGGNVSALEAGPASLDAVLGAKWLGLIPLVRFRRALTWRDFPDGGVHLDRARRTLATWWSGDTGDARRRVERAWPGWTIDWLFDDYARHFALCGGALTVPAIDVAATQRTILDTIEAGLTDAPPRNPARDIPDLGEDAQISEWTDHSRGREHAASKRQRVAELRRELGL